MIKRVVIGFLYVSTWVIIWGTVGSLIDFPLLKNEIYVAGSLGQIITFLITGLISIIASINLFPKLISSRFN